MKRFIAHWRVSLAVPFAVVLLSVALAWAAGPLTADESTADSTVVKPELAPADPYGSLRTTGFQQAMSGDFEKALETLRKASGLRDDEAATLAVQLLRDYRKGMKSYDAQRLAEYEQAVARVSRAMMADQHKPRLEKEERWKPFNEKIFDGMATAYSEASTAETVKDVTAVALPVTRSKTLEKLRQAREDLAETVEMFQGKDNAFAKDYREQAKILCQAFDKYIQAWEDVDVSSDEAREKSVETLRDIEDHLADALADVETFAASKPWQLALAQARLAKEIAPDKKVVEGTPWYKQLIREIEEIGARAMKEAEWYDAFSAYSGLYEIERDNTKYEKLSSDARRHVHVLRLYGKEKKETTTTQPGTTESSVTWKDVTSGIDARMVEDAISRMARAYVSTVDYRKLTLSGLRAVKILAETPQAANAFPKLADKKLKARFVASIDQAIKQFDKKTHLDNLCLQLALNKVLFASEDTVEIPTQVLAMEFTDGFLDELDRFSSMIWPYDVEDFNKLTMGKFIGVGVQISKESGQPLTVVTPLVGSPAYKAGVKTNDQIIEVDGVKTTPLSINKLVRMITGEEGTTVTLTIKRPGSPKPHKVGIVRKEIHIRTVKGWRRKSDGEWDYRLDADKKVGYLRLTQFTAQTAPHLAEALQEIRSQGVRSVILDLRFNPGGLLRSARDVTGEFLPAGTVVTTKGRQIARQVLRVNGRGSYHNGDLVVLVNELSASAAEIVSGALQDWKRAVIVGQRSYGKGSVQNVIDLGDRRAYLKLTTAYYYLPSNRLLHRRNGDKKWGVDPDVEAYVTPDQMREWLDIRRRTDLVQDVDPQEQDETLHKQYKADLQLRTGVLLLKMMKLRKTEPAAATATADKAA